MATKPDAFVWVFLPRSKGEYWCQVPRAMAAKFLRLARRFDARKTTKPQTVARARYYTSVKLCRPIAASLRHRSMVLRVGNLNVIQTTPTPWFSVHTPD